MSYGWFITQSTVYKVYQVFFFGIFERKFIILFLFSLFLLEFHIFKIICILKMHFHVIPHHSIMQHSILWVSQRCTLQIFYIRILPFKSLVLWYAPYQSQTSYPCSWLLFDFNVLWILTYPWLFLLFFAPPPPIFFFSFIVLLFSFSIISSLLFSSSPSPPPPPLSDH